MLKIRAWMDYPRKQIKVSELKGGQFVSLTRIKNDVYILLRDAGLGAYTIKISA